MSKTTPPKARQAKKKSSVSNDEAVNEDAFHPIESEHEGKIQRLPSQFELATLAAALHSPEDSPDATAERALAVWQACEMRLVRQRLQYSQEFYEKSKIMLLGMDEAVTIGENGIVKNIDEGAGIPLLDFLKIYFSKNSKPEHMMKKFRDFLRDYLFFASFDPNFNPDDLDTEELEKLQLDGVDSMMQRYREKGVAAHDAIYLYEEFKDFLERTDPEIKKERARKGGIARREKAEAKAEAERMKAQKVAKKTAAKKNPLEARATARKRPKQKKAGRKQ